ncbi:two-component system, OmpR family, phosphate regulon sensor histidine kinase PhoR [Sphingomonas palmae]|uniref:histidine kinase n=1 Tax=Sphingomonas palmae TaxID=1855283 RepID=A0A1H7TZV0_9SPHN|nr:ATP-binding protein [Sphingomonas palmae]SEL90075.1 two-component system, OmpR family, phosphate regulon sensor histidine kinase PhoR [Sphingomonas palmae]
MHRDHLPLAARREAASQQRVIEGFALRTWLAGTIAVVTAAIVFAYSRDVQLALIALVGGATATVIARSIGDNDLADIEAGGEGESSLELAPVLEAILDPVVMVRDGRVIAANGPARLLLGQHIIGEDVRTAIRHPAASDYLTMSPADRGDAPIELVGLGAQDRRWQMRATETAPGTQIVHLLDQTGQHAAERMRVDFVANASHELRTPLSSILGYVETLSDEAGDDPAIRRRFLGIVFDEATRMERLVEDLMSLSRIEAEKFRLPSTTVDLAVLAIEVHEALRHSRGARGEDVVLRIGEDVPPVAGDRVQLSQLLHNLIGNAMKYGRAGTPVTVTLKTGSRDAVLLQIEDESEGIAPEHLPRLTERFYRVDAGRSRSLGGTGLGLAIVKHIVERHRGRLDIASVVGTGTRVTVTLRAAER